MTIPEFQYSDSGAGLDPLAAPGRRLERICEILGLMDHLLVSKLHNADGEGLSTDVADRVLRDPDITAAENSADFEA